MSDEQKIEEEVESDDDVEAHSHVKQANDEGTDDGSDDVEAHSHVKQSHVKQ